jgi:transglutaminase-like putative cysteine protease
MITSYRILLWFACQFAVGFGAAVWASIDIASGVLAALVALVLSLFTLHLGWTVRHRKNALKLLSDGVAVLGLVAFLYLLFTENLVMALGALLFAAQLAMNLVLREYRQLYFGLVITFVFILGGAAEAVSGGYLLVLLVYGLTTSFCFAEIWLDRHRGDAAHARVPSMWQRARVAGILFAVALVFYLAMPRPPAANLGSQQWSATDFYTSEQWEQEADQPPDPESARPDSDDQMRGESTGGEARGEGREGFDYSGFDNQFDINQAGVAGDRNSNAIVAYMRAPHGGYLKARTFDEFDGIRWHASSHRHQKKRTDQGWVRLQEDVEGNYRQVIDVEQTLPAFIPAASQPVNLWLPSSVIAVDAWQQPLLPGPIVAGTRYTVDSRVEFFEGRPIGGRTRPRPGDLQLPQTLDPRIPDLARQVTAGAGSDFERASQLEHHLRTGYEYSFESIFDSQGVTPLPRFLFEEKRGHCEYFASAMVVLLRSLDIPARLVTGFSATQKNPMTGYYEIRALDGHAWAEAWLPEAGWVTFEPTAFYDMPRPREDTFSAEQINDYVKSLQQTEDALGAEDWSISRLLSGLWQSVYAAFVVVIAWLKLAAVALWPAALALTVMAGALLITRPHWQPRLTFLLSRWRIKHYRPADNRHALRFYLFHLQRMTASQGVVREPGEPVEHWARRLRTAGKEDPAIDDLATLVNQVVYEREEVSPRQIRQAALAVASVL